MTPGACSSPSLQQQQQPPPPPYGMPPGKPPTPSSGKLQKAGIPEKYDKLNKSGSASPHPGNHSNNMLDPSGAGPGMMMGGGGGCSSGLQTTPSPQLMNYIEFEGQELTITKQVNLSYKGGPCDNDMSALDQKPPMPQQQQQPHHMQGLHPPPPPPPVNQNSAILNCLNSNNNNNNSPVIGQQMTPQHQQQQQPGPNDDDLKIKNEFVDTFGAPTQNDLSSPLGKNNNSDFKQLFTLKTVILKFLFT